MADPADESPKWTIHDLAAALPNADDSSPFPDILPSSRTETETQINNPPPNFKMITSDPPPTPPPITSISPKTSSPTPSSNQDPEVEAETFTIRHATFSDTYNLSTTTPDILSLATRIGSDEALRAVDRLFNSDEGVQIAIGDYVGMIVERLGDVLKQVHGEGGKASGFGQCGEDGGDEVRRKIEGGKVRLQVLYDIRVTVKALPAENEEEPDEIPQEVDEDVSEDENLESEDDESKDGKILFPEWQNNEQTTNFGDAMEGVYAEDTNNEENREVVEEDEESADTENIVDEIGVTGIENEEKDGGRAKSGKPLTFSLNGQVLTSGGGRGEASSNKRSASELKLQESPPKRSR